MRRNRFASFLLLLVILLNCIVLPCFATDTPSTAADASSSAASDDASSSSNASDASNATESSETSDRTVRTDAPAQLTDLNLPVDFQIKAKSAALIDLETDTLAYAYEIDQQIFPASLTKIMTCMLALEFGNLDDTLTVSETALNNLNEAGSSVGLVAGEEMNLRDLLYCVMLSSANEACNVVAEYISGNVDQFVALMNEQAAALGMTSTHFENTHGLHDENHYSTVRDLAVLARWAWQDEAFHEFATASSYTVPATNLSESRTLHTTNYLISDNIIMDYYYDKASGIKTGFTTPAGACLISTAGNGTMRYMSIVCGCNIVDNGDGTSKDERFTETKRLFEFGFDNFSYVQVLANTQMVEMPSVLYAQGRENVVVYPSENITVLLPDSCDTSQIKLVTTYDSALEAPLEAKTRVGTVSAVYDGITLASCDLITLTAVERSTPKYVAEKTGGIFSDIWQGIRDYWFITIPLVLLLLFLIAVLVLRSINARKAKKRAMRARKPGKQGKE